MGLCPVCRSSAADADVRCPDCHTRHHRECWEYNGGCAKYGCAAAPETEKISDLEVPVAYWGQNEKACPVCQNVIQAAALRCRHCGAVFDTAKPQDTAEFQNRRNVKDDQPGLRKAVIWLLIFCALPCTATLGLVVGGIWYYLNRGRIKTLPVQHAAIARIGLGVAALQTVLLLVFAAIHSLKGGTMP